MLVFLDIIHTESNGGERKRKGEEEREREREEKEKERKRAREKGFDVGRKRARQF